MTRYISAADTAKLIREALKESFPAVKFSVRSKTYSGGASVRVTYQDDYSEATCERCYGTGDRYFGGNQFKSDCQACRGTGHTPNLPSSDVKQVAERFQGASFDAMIDLKSYHTSDLNGEQVHFGADWVFVDRLTSADR